MVPYFQISFGIYEDKVRANYYTKVDGGETLRVIESYDDYVSFLDEMADKCECQPEHLSTVCYRSMDLPEAHTADSRTVALANAIRKGSVFRASAVKFYSPVEFKAWMRSVQQIGACRTICQILGAKPAGAGVSTTRMYGNIAEKLYGKQERGRYMAELLRNEL